MPHVVVNMSEAGLSFDRNALTHALSELPTDAPIIVLIHGYKYIPGDERRCPHTGIFSQQAPRQSWKVMSWPRHLKKGAGPEPLIIAFGWPATGSIWGAWRRAETAGIALSELVSGLDRPVHILAHSLGARVALCALAKARAGSIGRLVLIAGADLRAGARAALASPAGRHAEVLNVTSRENAPFDLMLEAAMGLRGRAIGAGLDDLAGWTDLPVDCVQTRARLARMGYRISAPQRRFCHWSLYLRPGLFPLYRDVLRNDLPLARLAAPTSAARPLLPFAFDMSS